MQVRAVQGPGGDASPPAVPGEGVLRIGRVGGTVWTSEDYHEFLNVGLDRVVLMQWERLRPEYLLVVNGHPAATESRHFTSTQVPYAEKKLRSEAPLAPGDTLELQRHGAVVARWRIERYDPRKRFEEPPGAL